MLPKCILLSPTVSGPLDRKYTLHLVRERLRLWSQGSLSDLWDEALKEADKVSVSFSSSTDEVNLRHSRRAVEDGQYHKAIQALSSRGLAPDNDETYPYVLDLHPQSLPLRFPPLKPLPLLPSPHP